MDLGSALRVLVRRWLIVLIGLVLTLGVSGYLYKTTEPQYQASGSMLLLLPNNARGPDSVESPFLYLPNGLNVLASLVTGATGSREFREEMAAEGLHSSFQLGLDSPTPIIHMTVQGTEPDNVIKTRDWLIDAMNEELLRVQQEEGTPPSQTAHTRVFGNEDVPLELGGDWMRSVLAAVAAGGLFTLIATFAIDRLFAIRRARRQRRSKDSESPHNSGAGEPRLPEAGPQHADLGPGSAGEPEREAVSPESVATSK